MFRVNWRVSVLPPVPPNKKPGVGRIKVQDKTKKLALISMYAALYAALVIFLPETSYGPIQLRIADSLVAAIPLFGFAGVLGHTLGVFISGAFSPLGLIDLLNTVPSFVMAFIVYFVYKKSGANDYTVIVTCLAYSAVVGTTVGYMLAYILDLPVIATVAYVIAGSIIVSTILGWPLFKVLKKIGIQQLTA